MQCFGWLLWASWLCVCKCERSSTAAASQTPKTASTGEAIHKRSPLAGCSGADLCMPRRHPQYPGPCQRSPAANVDIPLARPVCTTANGHRRCILGLAYRVWPVTWHMYSVYHRQMCFPGEAVVPDLSHTAKRGLDMWSPCQGRLWLTTHRAVLLYAIVSDPPEMGGV